MSPDLENLRCFVAVARHLNFRRAASEVGLTPPAFGQRIKALEEGLGVTLLTRTTRHVALTEAGLRLVPAAQEALAAAARCAQIVRDDDAPQHMLLGTRVELGLSWVVPCVIEAQRALPYLTIELYFGASEDILERLGDGLLDAIITSAPRAQQDWVSLPLHQEAYVFVGAPALLARLPLTTQAHAQAHTLLDVDASLPLTRYLINALPAPLRFAQVRRCGGSGAMHALVLAGLGVAVLPRYVAQPDLDAGRLIALWPELSLASDTFRLLHRSDAPCARACDQLAALMRELPLR